MMRLFATSYGTKRAVDGLSLNISLNSRGIDLYDDGSCNSHPTPYGRRNTSQGTKNLVEVSLLLDALNGSVPSEPPQVGATAVSETGRHTKRKTSGRKGIRKLLAWFRLRCGGVC